MWRVFENINAVGSSSIGNFCNVTEMDLLAVNQKNTYFSQQTLCRIVFFSRLAATNWASVNIGERF